MFTDGGMKDASMNRLAKLYDCTTHQSILPKINALGKRHLFDLGKWTAEGIEYSIVFDNVDILTRPRRESAKVSNKMHHMVQAMAVQERVKVPEKKPPAIPIDSIKPGDVIAKAEDEQQLRRLMVDYVKRILQQECPGISSLTLEPEEHQYSHLMKKPTPMVLIKYRT